MTAPTYVVEAAFGVNALTDPGAWTVITPYVRVIQVRRGRNHELGRTQAGVCGLVLDNTDRRFDPTNASGPYYPNVRPMTHIRVRTTAPQATSTFRGYVQDWGQAWAGPMPNVKGDALINLAASDAFLVLALTAVKSYRAEVIADAPWVYWPLTDGANDLGGVNLGTDGAPALFRDVNTPDGNFSNYTGALGRASSPYLIPPGATTLDVPNTGSVAIGSIDVNPGTDLVLDPITVEFWVLLDSAATSTTQYVRLTSSGGAGYSTAFDVDAGSSPTTGLAIKWLQGGVSQSVATGALLSSTATWYHVAVTRSGSTVIVYLNGAEAARFTGAAAADLRPTPQGFGRLELGKNMDGALAHVAVYAKALPPERIAAHYAVILDELVNLNSHDAITAILDAMGWPAGLRAIDTGGSIVTLSPDGFALDLLQQIAEDTEHGILDVTGDGKIRFVSRPVIDRKLAASATFGDGGGEIPYGDLELAYDDQDLWTRVTATGPGGFSAATDASAAAAYGTRTLDVTTLAVTQNDLDDQATGLLNRYKAPAVRPRTVMLRGDRSIDQALTRSIGDHVTVKRRPPGGGTLTAEAIIEGVSIDAAVGTRWPVTTFALAPMEPLSFWVLADATFGVLDSTTRLGW